ncbi:MAG: hypothetical protein ACXVX9_12180 [Mycobacteriaceae bacterium]
MTATADALRYIANNVGWLAHHQEALQAFDELEHISALVDIAIDTKPPQSYAGRCDVCRKDMYAEQGAESVECKVCRINYPMADRRDHLLSLVADQLDTASNLSAAITELGENVTPEVIRKWAERGRLIAKGKDHRGRPTYRVGDVLELRKTMKRRNA